jgi:DNA-binding NtrC family response regulator
LQDGRTPSLSNRKVLVIDNDHNANRRRERVLIFKKLGFRIFPARMLEQLQVRCRPGAFDLVVVHASTNIGRALELCDEIRRNQPNQLLLFITPPEADVPTRDYIRSDDLTLLEETVEALSKKSRGSAAA